MCVIMIESTKDTDKLKVMEDKRTTGEAEDEFEEIRSINRSAPKQPCIWKMKTKKRSKKEEEKGAKGKGRLRT